MSKESVGSNQGESTNTDDSFFLSPDRINVNKDDYEMRVLLTNARSLAPKIASLQTAFDEQQLDLALVTES